MRRRLQRASLAAVLLATLLIPAVGSLAGGRRDLQQTQDQLERVRSRIEANSEQARSLRSEINDLNSDITKLQIAINKLTSEVAAIESKIHGAEVRIDQTQSEIDAVRDRATAQAIELYKAGGTETIDALLNAPSIGELNDRLEMIGVAARENTDALVQYSRLQGLIQDQQRDLFNSKQDLDHKLESQSKLQADIDSKRDALADKLDSVRTELAHDEEHEGSLVRQSRELHDDIVEQQAKSTVEALGTSGKGFIWPVSGPITSGYGARWGGMHTGIDIGVPSGTVVVAAKEGTVILAQYYSGYGNTVIIDHGGGISTLYAHNTSLSVSSGQRVKQGQLIAYSGSTGNSTGPHVHFEVRVNGSPVNPMPYLP